MNTKISPLLRWLTAFEVCVLLVAGGGLLFFPESFSQYWAWDLKPFNTGFLGAVYLTSMLSALAIVIYPYWSIARIVIPMIAVFTTIVLDVSIVYFERFIGPTYALILWFVLYIVIAVNAIFHLWLYRNQSRMADIKLSGTVRFLLRFQILFLGLYGIGLLIAPQIFSAFWSWQLDDFHARLYSVAFITPAVGAYCLSRSSSRNGLTILGITQITGGVLPLLTLNSVDRIVERINWLDFGTQLWMMLFIYILLSGIGMLFSAYFQTQESISILEMKGFFNE